MYKPIMRYPMKNIADALLIFQKGNIMSGKFEVVNNTYILNIVCIIVSKYFAGSTNGWLGVENSTYPIKEKKSI